MLGLKEPLQLKTVKRIPFYDSVLFCFDKIPNYSDYVLRSVDYASTLGFSGVPIFTNLSPEICLLTRRSGVPEIDYSHLDQARTALEQVKKRDLDIGFVLTGPFTNAYSQTREKFLENLVLNPTYVRRVLDHQTCDLLEITRLVEDLVDFFVLMDPMASNDIISPTHFYDFCAPQYKTLSSSCSKPVILHSPGKNLNNLPYIISSGINGIQPIDEDDLVGMLQKASGQICVIGNISKKVIAKGTEQDIYQEVGRCLSAARTNGNPFILHSDFWIRKDTPIEKVKILMKAIKENG